MSMATSEFSERTAILLRGALGRAEALGEEALAPLNLSGREFGVLMLLQNQDSPANQGQIGAMLGLDRTTTMKLAAGLEERGLVWRRADPNDRRSYQLKLTTAGRRRVSRAGRVLAACDQSFTDGRLSEQETVVLKDLLLRLQ